MTKKIFNMVASVISRLDLDKKIKVEIANAFANEFCKYNSRFDPDRFKEAAIEES